MKSSKLMVAFLVISVFLTSFTFAADKPAKDQKKKEVKVKAPAETKDAKGAKPQAEIQPFKAGMQINKAVFYEFVLVGSVTKSVVGELYFTPDKVQPQYQNVAFDVISMLKLKQALFKARRDGITMPSYEPEDYFESRLKLTLHGHAVFNQSSTILAVKPPLIDKVEVIGELKHPVPAANAPPRP